MRHDEERRTEPSRVTQQIWPTRAVVAFDQLRALRTTDLAREREFVERLRDYGGGSD